MSNSSDKSKKAITGKAMGISLSSDLARKLDAATGIRISSDFARQLEKIQKSASAFSWHYEKQMSAIPKLSQDFLFPSLGLSKTLLNSSAFARMSQNLTASTWKLPDELSDSLLSTNAKLNDIVNRFYGQGLVSAMLQQALDVTDQICSDPVEDNHLKEQLRSAQSEIQELHNNSMGLELLSETSSKILLWLLEHFFMPLFVISIGMNVQHHIDNKTSMVESAKTHRDVKALTRCYSSEEKLALSGCRVVFGDGLLIRGTPSIKGNVIASLPVGKIVTVLDSSERSWLLIEADVDGDTVEGWISRRYTAPFR